MSSGKSLSTRHWAGDRKASYKPLEDPTACWTKPPSCPETKRAMRPTRTSSKVVASAETASTPIRKSSSVSIRATFRPQSTKSAFAVQESRGYSASHCQACFSTCRKTFRPLSSSSRSIRANDAIAGFSFSHGERSRSRGSFPTPQDR